MSSPAPHNHPDPAEPPFLIPADSELPPCSTGRKLLIGFLAILLLAAGITGSLALFRNRPVVQRKIPPVFRTSVRVQILGSTTVRPVIEVLGEVVPAREIHLRPAVSGTVLMVNPNLRPGGFLQKGEVVLRLDDRDYRLAVEQSRQRLEKARMDLRLEEGQQAVARREFELMQADRKKDLDQLRKDLILRQPQLAKARAAEETARLELEQACLNLDKTVLRAPYAALVRTREVSVGSQVTPQSVVAELVGTDSYWVRAVIPRSQVDLVPLDNGERQAAEVTIRSLPKGSGMGWTGRIIGLLPEVESHGLLARLLITVPGPVRKNDRLLLGSRVIVRIPGRELVACFRIGRDFVGPDNTVFLADADNRLEIRSLTPVFQDRHWLYVQDGLQDGERLIVSPLAAPVDGMLLQIASTGPGTTPYPND